VLGSAERPVRRDGARPGDRVYVTGRLGGPRAALRLLERGAPPPAALRARFARPVARIAEARWLAARGVRALIDVSDGLTADLQPVAAASGVRVVLDVDRVPVVDGAGAADALASGEEYELALTSSEVLDTAAFGARFGVELTEIGRVTRGESGVEAWRDDARVDLTPGYDHLSG
jgi:thiamine-monophosphate kinase